MSTIVEVKVVNKTKSSLIVKSDNEVVLDIDVNIETLGGEKVNSISARDLYETLGVGRDYTTWIKGRIDKYGFEKNVDYMILWDVANSGGVNFLTKEELLKKFKSVQQAVRSGWESDYIVTIDMAKELAMVENNEKGRKVRKGFIKSDTKLSEIMSNGYYIKDNLTNKQEIKLVTEVIERYDRRIIDLKREAMVNFVIAYLVDEGYTKRQANSLLASTYNILHATIINKTASKIVYDIMMDDKLANIQTYNTLRKLPKIYSSDHSTALNFYNEDQLNEFGKYYEYILSSAVSTIQATRVKPTPLKVREAIEEDSKTILRRYSGLENGEVLKGINRIKLNGVVDKLYHKGFILSEEEKETVKTELMSLRSRSFKISF